MSSQLTSSIAPDRALWHIAKIEEDCEDAPESQDVQRVSGPFGVFRLGITSPESTKYAGSAEEDELLLDSVTLPSSDDLIEELDAAEESLVISKTQQSAPEARDCGFMDDLWAGEVQWTSLEPVNLSEWWTTSPQTSCFQNLAVAETASTLDQRTGGLDLIPREISLPRESPSPESPLKQVQPSETCIPPTIEVDTPQDAIYLLKHYSTTVLQGLTPYRHSKTPWHILFIPHVKSCLAAITMGEELTHASLCTFFGILSSSASSLSYIHGSKRWQEQAALYKQRAREHARLMLHTAYDVPKVAKYKVILMALLTMIQISTVSRNLDQTETYFLETEKFIRVKGLSRRKSRKVRLLHHCYVFERMLHESTYLGRVDSQHRRHVRQAIESSGAVSFSYDGLSFGALDLQNLDQQMMRVKGQDEGENDLHLKYPGVWAATQFPEIYIFLLSATIRLRRWKEDAFAGSLATGLKEFMQGAKEVETFILSLKNKPESVALAPLTDPEQHHCQQLLDILSSAMQQALTIYFYRKVYDVDASTLQHLVRGVSECLKRCETLDRAAGNGSVRLIWPAYIAAIEAAEPALREDFMAWFRTCAKRSGLPAFQDTREDIEKIWGTVQKFQEVQPSFEASSFLTS
ncbi:fungal specific transcription factor domain-containing protein [Sarocladium implicatum]|nr:fungal specific transcription factor domain-containing protein [Sarocladium implicatum]